jgi:hypothetical protein
MSYNIEEHEDYLKRQMPYSMEEGQWEAMQQRLKDKVLHGETTAVPLRQRKPLFKIALGAAAGILLLFSVFIFMQQGKEQTGIPPKANPEQYLDKTISSLNEQELNWMHELNENEIPEQEEYFEN